MQRLLRPLPWLVIVAVIAIYPAGLLADDESEPDRDWKSLPLAEFVEAAERSMRGAEFEWESSLRRTPIAIAAKERFLFDAELLASVESLSQWSRLMGICSPTLTAADLDRMRKLYRERVIAGGLIANVPFANLEAVLATARPLEVDGGGEIHSQMLLVWTNEDDNWKSLSADELRRLIIRMVGSRGDLAKRLKSIAAHAESRFVDNDELWTDSEQRESVLNLASAVAVTKPKAKEKPAFAAKLWSRYVGDRERLTDLSLADMLNLRHALFAAGLPGKFRSPIEPWVEASDRWKKLDAQGLSMLIFIANLDRDQIDDKVEASLVAHAFDHHLNGPGNAELTFDNVDDLVSASKRAGDKAAKTRALAWLRKKYVADEDRLASLSAGEATMLRRLLLDGAREDDLAKQIQAAYIDDTAKLKTLSVKEVRQVGKLVDGLVEVELPDTGDDPAAGFVSNAPVTDATARFTERWVEVTGGWRNKKLEDKFEIVRSMSDDPRPRNSPARTEMRRAIANHLAVHVLADKLPPEEAKTAMSVIARDLDRATKLRARQWLKDKVILPEGDVRARFAAARPLIDLYRKLDEKDGRVLDDLLVKLVMETNEPFPPAIELTDDPKEYLGYENRFWGRWGAYAVLFEDGTPRKQGGAHAGPPEPGGVVDLRMKRLFAAVDRQSAKEFPGFAIEVLTVWHTRQQMPDPHTAAPRKTVDRWRTFLESKAAEKGLSGDEKARWYMARAFTEELAYWEPTPLLGRNWLERALETAESEPLRVEIVQWMAQGLTVMRQFSEARDWLAKAGDQAGSPAAMRRLEQTRQQIAAGERGRRAIEAAAEEESRKRQIAELERRLAQARESGHREKIARYERLLQNIQ